MLLLLTRTNILHMRKLPEVALISFLLLLLFLFMTLGKLLAVTLITSCYCSSRTLVYYTWGKLPALALISSCYCSCSCLWHFLNARHFFWLCTHIHTNGLHMKEIARSNVHAIALHAHVVEIAAVLVKFLLVGDAITWTWLGIFKI